MPAEFLLDTNIFVYHADDTDTRKQQVAEDLVVSALESRRGCVSSQVVVECLNAFLRHGDRTMSDEAVRAYFHAILRPLHIDVPIADLVPLSIDLRQRYRVHVFDSLILASAMLMGCSTVYTEDL